MSSALILLVDPDQDSRDIFYLILVHTGFRVLEAHVAEEGLRLAREHRPHLIVTDFPLPVSGYSCLVEAARADATLSGTRIFAVTANAFNSIQEQAFRAGADAFLAKPVEPRRLVSEIFQVLVPPVMAK
jgi:CheY-like chemotaxis protein